jgi:putative transposase
MVQRCTVHKHRNLLAHAPERLHDEVTADYNDTIYATSREEIEMRRRGFPRKWRIKHSAVAESLQLAVYFHAPAAEPMAQRAHHQPHRAAA